MEKTRKLMYMSLLVAMALVLHIVERNIPVPFTTPGAKLGLANLVTVIALYTLPRKRDTFQIIIARTVLGVMFGGNASSLMYSISGAILSFMAMVGIKKIGRDYISVIGVSATGAVFHNIGQLIVASMILENIGVMLYLPVLSITGIMTGIFIGMAANYTTAHINKINLLKKL